MDKWAPLEPSRPSTSNARGGGNGSSNGNPAAGNANGAAAANGRFSLNTAFSSVAGSRNAYAPASSGTDGGLRRKSSLVTSPARDNNSKYDDAGTSSSSGGRAASGTTTTVTDAFPVGKLPSSVALRILQFVPVPTLAACALASRNLARIVADEVIWRRRLDSLQWQEVDGLEDTDEIHIIRNDELKEQREKAAREQEAQSLAAQSRTSGSSSRRDTNGHSSFDKGKPAPHRQPSEDEFGDFADGPTPSAEAPGPDSFGEFFAAPTPIKPGQAVAGHGGSLANGFASISIGAGSSHRAQVAPSFAPLTPGKPQRPGLRGNNSNALFSFRAEAKLPSPTEHRSYRMFRARARQMKPYLDSFLLRSSPTSTLLFTEPSLSLSSQPAMLANLARYLACPCLGLSLDKTSRLWPKIVEAAHYLHGILLPAFEGAEARRADAVRAGRLSGAENTKRAVERAEKDMKQHASGIWQLGRALALGNPQAQVEALAEMLKASDPSSAGRDMFVIDSGPDGQQATAGDKVEADAEGGASMGISAAQAFLEKRDILERGHQHDPLDNFSAGHGTELRLDFTPMDTFMKEVLDTVRTDGCLIARVFPPEQDVVLAFADRVAAEVVSVGGSGLRLCAAVTDWPLFQIADYVTPLLSHASSLSKEIYVRSCAATFAQALRMVQALQEVEPRSAELSVDRCEDVIYRAWEPNMDPYLRAEREWVQENMASVCEEWHRSVENDAMATQVDAAFLASHNPAAVKRTFLTGFKDVLLTPVVVVPRAAVYVGGAAIRTVGTGVAQLNPLRWQSKASSTNSPRSATPQPEDQATSEKDRGYVGFGTDGTPNEPSSFSDSLNEKMAADSSPWGQTASGPPTPMSAPAHRKQLSTFGGGKVDSRASTPVGRQRFARMQLLLSLDTALQLIQVNRDALRRVETFGKYPGDYGHRVAGQINDVATAIFTFLGEQHVVPGLQKAKAQIEEWRPDEHEQDAESHVAPLVHFFELTHVGDTIQQMVQVYYDEELARYIDKTDFLNPVVRSKKRFEASLDENVAAGLNAGVDLLMGQAEHIISSLQDPRDYYPLPGSDMDLGSPTKACAECIRCLKVHCRMLVGSTDKNVLEVFYYEVGLRLYK